MTQQTSEPPASAASAGPACWPLSRLSQFVVECGSIEHFVLASDYAEALRRIATRLHFGRSSFVVMARRAEHRAHIRSLPRRPRLWEKVSETRLQLFEFDE